MFPIATEKFLELEEAYRVMERYTADLAQRAEDVRAERPPAEEAD